MCHQLRDSAPASLLISSESRLFQPAAGPMQPTSANAHQLTGTTDEFTVGPAQGVQAFPSAQQERTVSAAALASLT